MFRSSSLLNPTDPSEESFKPLSSFVSPSLTDLYQITMAYSYWVTGKHTQSAVFDLYFRKNPFQGQFTVFAGLIESLKFIKNFKFRDLDIAFLKERLKNCKPEFFDYLANLDCSEVKIYALKEGTICFPMVPLIRVEGPIAVCQLLETPLLNLVNFPSLVATNALCHKLVAKGKKLVEFGLRRAQGPDGAMSASRYAVLGGFEGTSNVLAGRLFEIPISGTHAHSYVTSFVEGEELRVKEMIYKDQGGKSGDFYAKVMELRTEMGFTETNATELMAFAAYAISFPNECLCLVDTYDTLESGVKNFLIVARALHSFGYRAVGIRLDSGDLAYFSQQARKMFRQLANSDPALAYFEKFTIVASNDLTVETITALNDQNHEIDVFGVGTNLVTCKTQPALGCVYKLVQVDKEPRIKLSNEIAKVTIPGRKTAYRLYNQDGIAVDDLMLLSDAPPPQAGVRHLCRHPFAEHKRAYVNPRTVEELHHLFWDGSKVTMPIPTVWESREYVLKQINTMRPDHLRNLNPTPYKVSVGGDLFKLLHRLWLSESPIPEL